VRKERLVGFRSVAGRLRYAWLLGLVVLGAAIAAPPAGALRFSDVPTTHWAYAQISAVTNVGPAPSKRVLVDFGKAFKPTAPCTREELAKALVLAAGKQNAVVPQHTLPDVSTSDPYYPYIQIAINYGLISMIGSKFYPTVGAKEWEVDRRVVNLVRLRFPSADWSMLRTLRPAAWRPNPGWATGAPIYLPCEVAARALGLRFNHSNTADALEVSPMQAMDRAEVAYMIRQALTVSSWKVAGLAQFDKVVLPTLSKRQKEIVAFALQYVGYPYIWGGEYPTPNSPYGHQAHGGFDCSGFAWWVMKIHFGYPITDSERGAHDMAAKAKPRITLAKLVAGDLVFFGPKGPKSTVASIYHAAIALGNGWFIHSTGSNDGVSISYLGVPGNLTYWGSQFAWGRRLLKPSELP
jgi:cell wall-associated NlpC family hydrolase